MTFDNTLEFEGKKYRLTGKQPQGNGEMYVFREILSNNGSMELSHSCKIFQVYRDNGEICIECYNESSFLKANFKEYLEQC